MSFPHEIPLRNAVRSGRTPYISAAHVADSLAEIDRLREVLRDAIEEMDAWMLEREPTADDIDEMRSAFRAALAL